MSEGLVHPYKRDGEDGVNLFWGTVRSMSPGVMRRGIWKALHTAAPVLSNGTTPSRPWVIWPDQLAGGLVPNSTSESTRHPSTPAVLSGVTTPNNTWALLLTTMKVLKLCQFFFSSHQQTMSCSPVRLMQNKCDYSILWQHLSFTTCCIVWLNLALFLPLFHHEAWPIHVVYKTIMLIFASTRGPYRFQFYIYLCI